MKVWNIQELTGYEPKTTFYEDFSIADAFGISAIIDTYNRSFKHWKSNIEYLTELVMVLNWKIWEHFETNRAFAKVYEGLWIKTTNWVYDNVEGDDLSYFVKTTD